MNRKLTLKVAIAFLSLGFLAWAGAASAYAINDNTQVGRGRAIGYFDGVDSDGTAQIRLADLALDLNRDGGYEQPFQTTPGGYPAYLYELCIPLSLFESALSGDTGVFRGGSTCANDIIKGTAPVPPVPATILLLGTGLVGMVAISSRRKVLAPETHGKRLNPGLRELTSREERNQGKGNTLAL